MDVKKEKSFVCKRVSQCLALMITGLLINLRGLVAISLLLPSLSFGSFGFLESGQVKKFFIDTDVQAPKLLSELVEQRLSNSTALTDESSFYLFSHGRAGALLLDEQWLSDEALASKLKDMIGDADHLYIYGCDFAEGDAGEQALTKLAESLGITVFASSDITGAAGDWDLEVSASPTTKTNLAQNIVKARASVLNTELLATYPHSLQATLGIDKQVFGGITTQLSGAQFRYNIPYQCTGDAGQSCDNVVITDVLPTVDVSALPNTPVDNLQMEFEGGVIGLVGSQTFSFDTLSRTVTFDLGNLQGGTTGVISFLVSTPNSVTPNGTVFTNQATITSTTTLPTSVTTAPLDVTISAVSSPIISKLWPFRTGGGNIPVANNYALPFNIQFRALDPRQCGRLGITGDYVITDDLTGQPIVPTAATIADPRVNWNPTTRILELTLTMLDGLSTTCNQLFVSISLEFEFDPLPAISGTYTNTANLEASSPVGTTETRTDQGATTYVVRDPLPASGNAIKNSSGAFIAGAGGGAGQYRIIHQLFGDLSEAQGDDLDYFVIEDGLPSNQTVLDSFAITGSLRCDQLEIYYQTNANYDPNSANVALNTPPTRALPGNWVTSQTIPGQVCTRANAVLVNPPASGFVTALMFVYRGVNQGGQNILNLNVSSLSPLQDGGQSMVGDVAENCARIEIVDISQTPNVEVDTATDCAQIPFQDRRIGHTVRPSFTSPEVGGNGNERIEPGEQIRYSYRVEMETVSTSAGALNDSPRSLVAAALLSPGLSYVSNSEVFTNGFGAINANDNTQPVVTVISDFGGTGQQLVRWTFEENITPFMTFNNAGGTTNIGNMTFLAVADNSIPVGDGSIVTRFFSGHLNTLDQTYIDSCRGSSQNARELDDPFASLPSGIGPTDTFDIDGDGDIAESDICVETVPKNGALPAPLAELSKVVQGDQDTAFSSAGVLSNGGAADYQISVENQGNTPLENFVVYDVLPAVGDTQVSDDTIARNSTFTVSLSALIDETDLPSGSDVLYSDSQNPCRPEVRPVGAPLAPSWPAGCVDDWVDATAVDVIADVRALQIRIADPTITTGANPYDPQSSPLNATESISITVPVIVPALTPGDPRLSNSDTANNSAAFVVDDVSTGQSLLVAETTTVNLLIVGPADFGDLPDSYGTLIGGSGAYHFVDEFNIGELRLGTIVDTDSNGFDSVADGDDNDNLDDEDGVNFASRIVGSNVQLSAQATVTNTTGNGAVVCAWLDIFGGSGAPSGTLSEQASGNVCEVVGTDDLLFSWENLPPARGFTYARFRVCLTEANCSAPNTNPTAIVPIGEIEDYQIEFDFTPTAVTLGDFNVSAVKLDELMLSRDGLLNLLSDWDLSLANSMRDSNASDDEIIDALRYWLDPDGDGAVAVLEWDTLEERGTVGFYVERAVSGNENEVSWLLINDQMVPALVFAPLGAQYKLFDPAAKGGQIYQYRLIEQEGSGNTLKYGPFEVELK